MQTQNLIIALLLVFVFTSCQKEEYPQPVSYTPVYGTERGCVNDFELFVTKGDNDTYYFQGVLDDYQGTILQLYWMINNEIVKVADYPLLTYAAQIDPTEDIDVCLTFFDSTGCHRNCLLILGVPPPPSGPQELPVNTKME